MRSLSTKFRSRTLAGFCCTLVDAEEQQEEKDDDETNAPFLYTKTVLSDRPCVFYNHLINSFGL